MGQPLTHERWDQPPASMPLLQEAAFSDDIILQTSTALHGQVSVAGAREKINWTLEVPNNLAYEGLIVQVPGFGGIKRSSRGERHANAMMGVAAVSYSPARFSWHVGENLSDSQELHFRELSAVTKAVQQRLGERTVKKCLPAVDGSQLILSAHSMGKYAATRFANRHASLVESIIYKGAAGFGFPNYREMDEINYAGALAEIYDFLRSDQIECTPRNLFRIAWYYGCDITRTFGELGTCLTDNTPGDVVELHDKGVRTGYLGFENDPLVPPHRVADVVEQTVDQFDVLEGTGHLAPQRHPTLVAKHVFAMYQELTA